MNKPLNRRMGAFKSLRATKDEYFVSLRTLNTSRGAQRTGGIDRLR